MCPNYTPPKTECSNQPEASQPLSAAVEAAVNDFENRLKSETYAITMAFLKPDLKNLRSRLASLWPKAGQVPSKAELQVWLTKHSDSGIPMEDGENLHKWLLSRMGQPSPLKGDQPSPVTAEKAKD